MSKSVAFFLIVFFFLAGQVALAQEEKQQHIVQDLDNYYSLSLKYDVSIVELKKANPGISSPKPGDVLIIPRKGEFDEVKESLDCAKFEVNRNKKYRIALMIPLYLEHVEDSLWSEQLDPENINEIVPFRFIQFYHGFIMAADSLRKIGLNVEINVYDVDHQVAKVSEILMRPELKQMDMIFGPFFKNSFSIAAHFARENQITIINPLSARTDILQGNPYVFKLLPSADSQPAIVAELCRREFYDHNIILYTPNKFQNQELIFEIKLAIEKTDPSGMQRVAVVDYLTDSIHGFHKHASLDQTNLVIIFAENEVLPSALLSELSALKSEFEISVIGLPEWDKFNNLESNYLISLKAHIFMSAYTDLRSDHNKDFIRAYRQRFMDEPLNYAYSGFDAAYFFLSALMSYGRDFYRCIDEIHTPLIQNQFQFDHKGNNGYDNVNWNVMQYMGYSLIKKSL